MDSASPTLTRCIEICLAYLGFGAATLKRVTYETANYVAAEGSVGIQQNPDVPLRTSGAASVQAGSTVPVLWTRKNLAPGHRGVGPAKILKHEAARAQGTAPPPPRPRGAAIEEILWWNPHGPLAYEDPREAESAFYFRNADQVTKLNTRRYGPANTYPVLAGSIKFGQDDRYFGVGVQDGNPAGGIPLKFSIDVYRLNRARGGTMSGRATATFDRRITPLVVPFSQGGDWYLTEDLDVISARNMSLPEAAGSADPNVNIEIISAVTGQVLFTEPPPWNVPGGFSESLQILHWDKRNPHKQRFAYAWRFDAGTFPMPGTGPVEAWFYPLLVRSVGGLRIEAPGDLGHAPIQSAGGAFPEISGDTCRMGGIVSVSADGDTILTVNTNMNGANIQTRHTNPEAPCTMTLSIIHCPSGSSVDVGQWRFPAGGDPFYGAHHAWGGFCDYANHFAVGPTQLFVLREPFWPDPWNSAQIPGTAPTIPKTVAGRFLRLPAVKNGRVNASLDLVAQPLAVEGPLRLKDFPPGPQVSQPVAGISVANLNYMATTGGYNAIRITE